MLSPLKSVVIIICSILALIVLQGLWLQHVVINEKQNLTINIRLAALSALSKLEQKENIDVLVKNLDTIFDFSGMNLPRRVKRNPQVKMFVTNKNHFITINSSSSEKNVTQTYSFVSNGEKSEVYSAITSISEDSEKPSNIEKKLNNKVKSYETLLKRIAFQTRQKNRNILQRISFDTLGVFLSEALKQRGIYLKADYAITKNEDSLVKATINYNKEQKLMSLPMFNEDIVRQNYNLHIAVNHAWTYYYRKSLGMICVSMVITILLIVFIVLLYKRMRNEQLLNKHKNDFINNLTHELKTPLATISIANANIQSNTKYNKDERTLQYTNIIEEEAQRLNTHIEKVLALSFLEKNEQVLQHSLVDINVLISSLEKSFKDMCSLKNGSLEVFIRLKHSFVYADAAHLSNCLFALIDNALKYTVDSPKLIINADNVGEEIKITVKDNGMGIAKENHIKVFEKFFRISDKDLHTTKGFGLGLSYVKQVLEMMGGRVELNSELNKGAEFIICLPYEKR